MNDLFVANRRAPSGTGYEVSSKGDKRFSALYARFKDGRSIEEAYQLDVKGYRVQGNDWRCGKGKPPLVDIDLWPAYLALWTQWANENPLLIEDLRHEAQGKILTDMFASSPISQARALAQILNSTSLAQGLNDGFDNPSEKDVDEAISINRFRWPHRDGSSS